MAEPKKSLYLYIENCEECPTRKGTKCHWDKTISIKDLKKIHKNCIYNTSIIKITTK